MVRLLAPLVLGALLLPAAAPISPGAREVRLAVAPSGNQARYKVQEQLAGRDLPNLAVGVTDSVAGAIVLTADGQVDSSRSRISVQVTGLKSDRSFRDRYVRGRILDTEQYPTVVLAPTAIRNLPWPLPSSGARSMTLVGDLTVHGTTRPTTWQLTATFRGDTVTGTATTGFTFETFGLSRPRVPIVLSVADTIGLEYDFRMVKE